MGRTALPVLALSFTLLLASGPPRDGREDDLEARVAALSKTVEAEKQAAATLRETVRRLEARFQALATGARALDRAADEARRNGFESAGANPRARTDILEGLKGLAAEILKGEAPPEEGRGR